jgi:hypothetical protein
VAVYHAARGRVAVPLTLQAGETRVLAFRHGRHRPHLRSTRAESVVLHGRVAELRDTRLPALPGPIEPKSWNLHVDAVGPDGTTPYDLVLDRLADWRDIQSISGESGTGTYTAKVTVPAGWLARGRGVYLQLGSVGGASQATVNGRSVGPQVVPEVRTDVSRLLHPGDNELRVVVATTLKNKMVSLARGQDPNAVIYLAQPATQPYGLLGPVQLVPFSRARVRLTG